MIKTIIFTLMLSLTNCIGDTMMAKLKKDTMVQHQCFPKIIEVYINSKSPDYALEPDATMKSICPKLMHSCCYKSNLEAIHDSVLETTQKMELFERSFKSVVSTIANAKGLNTTKFIADFQNNVDSNWEEDKEEEGEKWTEHREVTDLKKSIEYVQSNESELLNDLHKGVTYLNSINSRYACALCEQENHMNFKNIQSRNPSVLLDMSQCAAILTPEAISIFKVDNHMTYVYRIIQSMTKLRNGHSPNDYFMTDNELLNIVPMMKNCAKDQNYLTDSKCQSICKSVKFFNQNVFLDIQKTVIAGSLLVNNYFQSVPMLNDSEMNIEYEKDIKRIVARFYVTPASKPDMLIENFPVTMYWGTGWNLMKQEFVMSDKPLLTKKIREGIKDYILKNIDSPDQFFEKTNQRPPKFLKAGLNDESQSIRGVALLLSVFMFALQLA